MDFYKVFSQDYDDPNRPEAHRRWTDNMQQVVGICIPDGCSLREVEKNYQEVYAGVNSELNGALFTSCVTDDFFEDYSSSIFDDISRGQKVFL